MNNRYHNRPTPVIVEDAIHQQLGPTTTAGTMPDVSDMTIGQALRCAYLRCITDYSENEIWQRITMEDAKKERILASLKIQPTSIRVFKQPDSKQQHREGDDETLVLQIRCLKVTGAAWAVLNWIFMAYWALSLSLWGWTLWPYFTSPILKGVIPVYFSCVAVFVELLLYSCNSFFITMSKKTSSGDAEMGDAEMGGKPGSSLAQITISFHANPFQFCNTFPEKQYHFHTNSAYREGVIKIAGGPNGLYVLDGDDSKKQVLLSGAGFTSTEWLFLQQELQGFLCRHGILSTVAQIVPDKSKPKLECKMRLIFFLVCYSVILLFWLYPSLFLPQGGTTHSKFPGETFPSLVAWTKLNSHGGKSMTLLHYPSDPVSQELAYLLDQTAYECSHIRKNISTGILGSTVQSNTTGACDDYSFGIDNCESASASCKNNYQRCQGTR